MTDSLAQRRQAGNSHETAVQAPPKIAVWYPRLASSGYSGPSANFMRLFKTGSDKVSFSLVTATDHLLTEVPFAVHAIARKASPLGKLAQVDVIFRMCVWLLVHRKSYDALYVLSAFHYSVIPAAMAKFVGLRTIIRPAGLYDYDPPMAGRFARLKALLKIRLLRDIDGVVAINTEIARKFVEYGVPGARICLAPNSIDTSRFVATRSQPRAAGKLTVVYVGGWVERKRLHVVIQAAALAAQAGVDVDVVAAGLKDEAAYARKVEAVIQEHGYADRFRWLGHVSQIEQVYAEADVFCLPTSAEGMPNALLEAMGCGLPVVTTDLPGTADIVRNDVEGFLLPQATDQELATRIAGCLVQYSRDPALYRRHSQAARARILDSFDSVNNKRRIEEFLAAVATI
jgi:glycosyltransferase involved in cell wall biosynthesis